MPGFSIPFPNACGVNNFGQGASVTVETARKHRYSLEVLEPLGSKRDGILLYGYKCNRPSIEFDEVAVHNGQDELFRPGKQHWKPVEFTFYEKMSGGGDKAQFNQAAELVYKWWGSTMIDLKTSYHRSPSEYLKNCQLDMSDGSGQTIWVYELLDCWPSRVSPSDLDYSSSDIAEITVALRYAKAREGRVSTVVARAGAAVQSIPAVGNVARLGL